MPLPPLYAPRPYAIRTHSSRHSNGWCMMDTVMYPVDTVTASIAFSVVPIHFPWFMFHYMKLNYPHRQQSANKSWCAHNSRCFLFLSCGGRKLRSHERWEQNKIEHWRWGRGKGRGQKSRLLGLKREGRRSCRVLRTAEQRTETMVRESKKLPPSLWCLIIHLANGVPLTPTCILCTFFHVE